MTGFRVSVGMPGATAGEVVALARRAEAAGLDGLWVGDPGGDAPNSDDSYTLVALAGAAALTRDLRLGAFLTARGSAPPLRLAEDIGVVDQISAGRLSLGLVPPPQPDPGWDADVRRVLTAWRAWEVPAGGTVAVTPAPAQPVLPVSIVRDGADPLPGHNAPVMVLRRWVAASRLPSLEEVVELRAAVDGADAGELLLLLGPDTAADDVTMLGSVLLPCARCPADEVPVLVRDVHRWWNECAHLHRSPGPVAELR
jgi:hypothetical protein